MNFFTRLGSIGAFGLVVGGLLYGTLPFVSRIYQAPSEEGALFSGRPKAVAAPPKEKATSIVKIRIPAEVDPQSLQPLDPKLTAELVSVKSQTEERESSEGRSIVVMLDNSMSMVVDSPGQINPNSVFAASDPNYERLTQAKRLIKSFKPADRVALACFPALRESTDFSNKVTAPQVLQDFTNPQEALASVDALKGAENLGTPLYAAITKAITMLKGESSASKYAMILTDGFDSQYEQKIPASLVKLAKGSDVKLIVIALGAQADYETMKKLTKNVYRANKPSELAQAMNSVQSKFEEAVVANVAEYRITGGSGPIELLDSKSGWRGTAR